MHVLTVRQIPDTTYDALAALAQQNRRSLQQQAILLLERARLLAIESPTDRARKIRLSLARHELGNTVAEIRAERDR